MQNETLRNEEIETETFRTSEGIYFRKNPEAVLEKEKIKILKRLKEIEKIEGTQEKREKLFQGELQKRKIAFKKFQQEKQLSQRQVNLFFQNSYAY